VRGVFAACIGIVILAMAPAWARDVGQWENTDPAVSKWYRGLMQPDDPTKSCCGESDAYWADDFETDGNNVIAIITDTREDAPLFRRHIAPGTRFTVPPHKLKYDKGNPTGHGVIFIGADGTVFCYVAPAGT